MLVEAQRARKFLQHKSRADLEADDLLAYGAVRAIEIVGEAAAQVTDETRTLYSQIPWRNTVGMRNWIVHDYNSIDLDIVWEVVNRNLPQLLTELEQIMPTL